MEYRLQRNHRCHCTGSEPLLLAMRDRPQYIHRLQRHWPPSIQFNLFQNRTHGLFKGNDLEFALVIGVCPGDDVMATVDGPNFPTLNDKRIVDYIKLSHHSYECRVQIHLLIFSQRSGPPSMTFCCVSELLWSQCPCYLHAVMAFIFISKPLSTLHRQSTFSVSFHYLHSSWAT